MLIAIFGESCTGKSTLASQLADDLSARIYTGKDYLRLAKNEQEALSRFADILHTALTGDPVIYVISESAHMSMLPEGTVRILMTADLQLIEERFSARMNGILPPPVKTMLEKKHGTFDRMDHHYHIHNGEDTVRVCKLLTAKWEEMNG